jgi:hypothetical protein
MRKNVQKGLHQTKELCTAKETVTRLTEWEKIFDSCFQKGTNTQNLQGTQKLNPQRINTTMKK